MPDPQDPPETPPGGPNTGDRAAVSMDDAMTLALSMNDAMILARIHELEELREHLDSRIKKLKAKIQQ